jgi:hypothetical protein
MEWLLVIVDGHGWWWFHTDSLLPDDLTITSYRIHHIGCSKWRNILRLIVRSGTLSQADPAQLHEGWKIGRSDCLALG